MKEYVLFCLVVFRDGGGEGGVEEAGHTKEHKNSVGTEVSVPVHGDAPE